MKPNGSTAVKPAAAAVAPPDPAVFALGYREPFDWDGLLAFIGARAIPRVESIAGERYRRSLRIDLPDGRPAIGALDVTRDAAHARLVVSLDAGLAPVAPRVLARLARLFDVDCDPLAVAAALGPLAADAPGLRLPGAVDPFELCVRAILGQQVTVAAARTLATRLVTKYGTPLADGSAETDAPITHLFPTAATIAAAEVDALGALGVIRARGRAIVAIADAIATGSLRLEPGADVAATMAALCAIKGIGPWTAHYLAMRALHWADAFPPGDVAVLRALDVDRPRDAQRIAEAWRPWRSYAVMHLWRRRAAGDAARRRA